MIDWKEIRGEVKRTYHYPGGHSVTFEAVAKLAVGKSGTHRLEMCGSGRKAIVAPGWLWIEIEADAWSL